MAAMATEALTGEIGGWPEARPRAEGEEGLEMGQMGLEKIVKMKKKGPTSLVYGLSIICMIYFG